MEGHWKFPGGGGVIKAKFLVKPCLKITQNFLGGWGGGGGAKQKPSVGGGGVWIFSGTAHWITVGSDLNFTSGIHILLN